MEDRKARPFTPAAALTEGGIEAQELAGQARMIASGNIPKDMRPGREAFERIGLKFGRDVDDLFISTILPPGWKFQSTDHAMWSTIVDEQSRERVGIFYKAAFYDRTAHCSLRPRYKIELCKVDGDIDTRTYVVRDGGAELFRTDEFKSSDLDAHDMLEGQARRWMLERFPKAEDPTAYW